MKKYTQILKFLMPASVLIFLAGISINAANATFYSNRDGSCPSREQFKSQPELERTGLAGLGRTAVIDTNHDIKIGPELAAAPLPIKFELFESVELYLWSDVERRVFVKSANRDVCGWIKADVLLGGNEMGRPRSRGANPFIRFARGPSPMKAGDLEHSVDDAEQLEGSTLKAKVALQNLNLEYDEENGEDGIPLYAAPGKPYFKNNVRKTLRLADVLYVYGFGKGEHLETGQTIKYYLVGRPADNSSFKILGWLSEADVGLWNTRFTAFWAGTGQAEGTVDDAALSIAGDFERISEPVPLLVPEKKTVPYFPVLREREDRKRNVTLQVMLPGSACTPQERLTDSSCKTSAQVDEDRRRFNEARQKLKNIDILFLIDNSKSMAEYFEIAGQAIEQYLQDLPSNNLNIRVAAAGYGDYRGGSTSLKNLQFKKISSFRRVNNSQARNGLKRDLLAASKSYFLDPEQDKKEATYAAIIRAADQRWGSETGIKVIVHIADHGNRDFKTTSNEYRNGREKSNLVEQIHVDQVLKKLKQEKVFYQAVAVRGDWLPEENKRFVDQSNDMLSRSQSTGEGFQRILAPSVAYNPQNGAETKDKQLKQLVSTLKRSALSAITTDEIIEREIERCQSDPASCIASSFNDNSTTPINNENWLAVMPNTIRDDLGLSPEQIKNIHARSQSVLPVWFKAQSTDEIELFNYAIAIDPGNVQLIEATFNELCTIMGTGNMTAYDLQKILERVIAAGSYEEFSFGGSFSEFFSKMFGFPAKRIHSFFNDSLANMETKWRSGGIETELFHKNICRTHLLVSKAIVNRKLRDDAEISWNAETKRWSAPDADWTRFNFTVPSNIGLTLSYLPLDYFEEIDF